MRRATTTVFAVVAVLVAFPAVAQAQYADAIASTPSLTAYWRLDEASGTVAHDVKGAANGTYAGDPGLGARGGLSFDADTSARFDGVDDEMHTGAAAPARSRVGSSGRAASR